MQDYAALAGIFASLTVGTISPGPSFLVVARASVVNSRSAGLVSAIGMGVGGVIFALAALLGLHAVLFAVPSLYIGLKVLGGMYLGYLGLQIWRNAGAGVAEHSNIAKKKEKLSRVFSLGTATQVSNPKTAIVYASVFAAFLPSETTLMFNLVVIGLVFLLEAGWYSVVAFVLSTTAPRRAYMQYKIWLDRVAGGVMMCLGLKLITSAKSV